MLKPRRALPALIAMAAVVIPSGAAASLQADYRFDNGLASAVSGAPRLHALNGATDLRQDQVDGHNDGVLEYERGTCLRLREARKVVGTPTTYTIAMTVRLNNTEGYNKLVDFDNLNEDYGLYVDDGKLDLWNLDSESGNIKARRYYQLAMTRAKSGKARGYIDGRRRVADTDEEDVHVLGADEVLHFLCDDGGSEESSGRIARLRIYDNALTDAKILDLGS